MHDKNTKEHLKNKFNERDLPQLTTNISVTSLKLKNSAQKLLDKQKKNKECQDRKIILFIRKQDLYSSDICLYCNEAMSDISDAEFYCLITKVYKPPKNFDFPETERSFLFVWFEEFPWVYYSRWEDGAYCLPCILFGHEVV